jgi:TolB-like protein
LNLKKLSPIWIFLLIASGVLTAYGAKKPPPTQTLQIQPFTTAENVTVTDKYRESMMKDIVKELTNTKRFQSVVLGTTGSPAQPTQPGILLTGQLLEYRSGSRAARIFAGGGLVEYGATGAGRLGEAKAKAHIQFIDSESGKILHEQDVESVVRNHPYNINLKDQFTGGSANETEQRIAKKIASAAKSDFK